MYVVIIYNLTQKFPFNLKDITFEVTLNPAKSIPKKKLQGVLKKRGHFLKML